MSCRSADLQVRIFIVDTMTRAGLEARAPARHLIGTCIRRQTAYASQPWPEVLVKSMPTIRSL
jgi:hypothetical protein